jgi:hypothetical protein
MAGGGGPCARHIGLPPTEAERAASRRNATKHGIRARGFRDEEERALYEDIMEEGLGDLRKQAMAMLALRVARGLAWEAKEDKLSPCTAIAFGQFMKYLPEEEAGNRGLTGLERAELVRQVHDILRENPQALVKYLPQPLREQWAKMKGDGAGTVTG